MIKRKIITLTTLALFSITMTHTVMAAPLPPTDENKIASQCLSYLKEYGDTGKIPAKLASAAAPTLGLCISHFSCQHKLLSGVSNCAHKLSNLALSAQINSITSTSAEAHSNTTKSLSTDKPLSAPVVIPPSPQTITPAQQPTSNTNKENEKPQQKPSINWF